MTSSLIFFTQCLSFENNTTELKDEVFDSMLSLSSFCLLSITVASEVELWTSADTECNEHGSSNTEFELDDECERLSKLKLFFTMNGGARLSLGNSFFATIYFFIFIIRQVFVIITFHVS